MIIAAVKVEKSISVIKSGLRPIERPVLAWIVFAGIYEVNENYISIPETHKKNRTM